MSRIKWPEKNTLQQSENDEAGFIFDGVRNKAIDDCITAEKEARVSVEEIQNILKSFINERHVSDLPEMPTIEQLERVLNSPDAPKIRIKEDGGIEALYSTEQIAQAIHNKIYGEQPK